MDKIEDLFKAKADSIKDTFLSMSGAIGFRIPIYQRQYAWRNENIERVFEDISQGLRTVDKTKDSVTFLGTVILVEENRRSDPAFDGASFSVVDGQQRLTTLCLIACELARRIDSLEKEIGGEWPDGDFGTWLCDEATLLAGDLQACIVNRPAGFGAPEPYQLIPRIVREECDKRARTAREHRYNSPVSSYIFSLAKYLLQQSSEDFSAALDETQAEVQEFLARLGLIGNAIDSWESGDEFTRRGIPDAESLVGIPNYRTALFPKAASLADSLRQVISECRGCDEEKFVRLLRLIAVGNYYLHRIAITRVEVETEDYAFDIFDALNTTGEPLTAIETFKPLVIRREEADTEGGYLASSSYRDLLHVEEEIENQPSNDARQRESRQVITALALYTQGDKIPESLNSQRTFLRAAYETDAEGANGRRRLVKAFRDIVDYRHRFWSRSQLPHELIEAAAERSEILFCLDFIRELGNTLTVPILSRYLRKAESEGDISIFLEAVRAVTAFLALRRGVTGATQGIDDDYRNLLKKGEKGVEGSIPLMIGLEREPNEIPDSDSLRRYLRSYLAQSKVRVADKDDWIERFARQPHYKTGKTSICRFFLLTAAHNAMEDPAKPYLLKKLDRPNERYAYRTVGNYRHEYFESTEHVAPQSREPNWGDDVYQELYLDPNAIHTVGNLTLLPKEENSAAGNDGWVKKKAFFNACGAKTDDELKRAFELAAQQEAQIGTRARDMLSNRDCLPLLGGLNSVSDWDLDIVRERSHNIGELIWDDLSPWLGL